MRICHCWIYLSMQIHCVKCNVLLESTLIVVPSASNQALTLALFGLIFLGRCVQHVVSAASRGRQDHTYITK